MKAAFTSTPREVPLPVTETILGISEPMLVTLSSTERTERFVRNGCFINEATGKLISHGCFSTPTVESLREQVASLMPSSASSSESSMDIPPLRTKSGVDIAELQGQLTTSHRAMVQVASNFNCLENASRRTRVDSGYLVDLAYQDCTQGPAAVFGTISAYLYRCHFYRGGQKTIAAPKHQKKPKQKKQQKHQQEEEEEKETEEKEDHYQDTINLLEHVAPYFGTSDVGKLTLSGTETPLRNEEDIDRAASGVCLGLHEDCPVLFGRSNRTITYHDPPNEKQSSSGGVDLPLKFPLVDHVLSASINLHDFGRSNNKNAAAISNLMRALLRAAYEGIYLAALLRQRKNLYLTLVGGGSFGNPIELIVEEIQRAHEKWASHPASQLEDVVICLYSEKDERHVLSALRRKGG